MYADPCGSGSGSTALAQDNPESLFSLACSVRYSKLAQVGPASILSMMHIQNVLRQNVTRQTSQDIRSQGQNVPGTKMSQGTKRPRDKTSQGRPKGKNVPRGQMRPLSHMCGPLPNPIRSR